MPEEPKEKLEYLRREEIRTMPKDLTKLRELEAQKERERIIEIMAEKKAEPPVQTPEAPKTEEVTLIPQPPPKKIPRKILIRGIYLIIFFLILGFLIWLGIKEPPPEEVLPPVEEIIPSNEEMVEMPEITILPSLISVEERRILEISEIEEIPEIFEELMKEGLAQGTFTQIVIKNRAERRLVSLEDLSLTFQIEAPEGFFPKLEENYTLAIYSQKEGERIFLIGKVAEKENFGERLKNWERKIEEKGIFLAGKKIPSLAARFRTFSFEGVNFRYLTISREDLGICYVWFNNYFIFTSSRGSMIRIIDFLKEEIPIKETFEEPGVIAPLITERIIDWGYYVPASPRTIDTVIIHSAYNAIGGDVHDLEKVIEQYRMYKVAPHYLISRESAIYRLVSDEAIAYHAGISRMPDGSRVNIINKFSIGIAMIYTKTESPNERQYQSLAQLVKYLRQQYNIPSENILGHNQIAPRRKDDPWNFDWEKFNETLK